MILSLIFKLILIYNVFHVTNPVTLNFSGETYFIIRDTTIILIGLLAALYINNLKENKIKQIKIIKFYKNIIEELNENKKIVEFMSKDCSERINEPKWFQTAFFDNNTIINILSGISFKIKSNVFDILNNQDLMFILNEEEYKLLFTTYKKYLDIQNYISMIKPTMIYDFAIFMGATRDKIAEFSKQQIKYSHEQIIKMCNEVIEDTNELIPILKKYL